MSLHNTQKDENSQSIQGVHHFWKLPGETLAVMLRRFREEQVMGEDEKLTYAGRLDPMAEGVVPILSGEARFQKDHMMTAAKTYEVDILLGISTDTGDMLGLVTNTDLAKKPSAAEIKEAIAMMADITELLYPNYSSRPVDGKPLFVHARAGKAVHRPIKNVVIHSLELLSIKEVPLNELVASAVETIKKVQGDFRQQETIEQWQALQQDMKVQVVSIRTNVSSGTYMRSLAEKLGELVGVPALAYRIVRIGIAKK
jgi:tRNA pseudouridine(55) synthase